MSKLSTPSVQLRIGVAVSIILTTAQQAVSQCDYKILSVTDDLPNQQFGTTVAISGEQIFVGTPRSTEHSLSPGAVYVFRRDDAGTQSDQSDDHWVAEDMLTAGDGPQQLDRFGDSIDADGGRIIIGAPFADEGAPATGSAYIFLRSPDDARADSGNAAWTLDAKLVPRDAQEGDRFGDAVAIAGDWAAVAATRDDDGCPDRLDCDRGSVYIFRRDDSGTPSDPSDDAWVQSQKLTRRHSNRYYRFGVSLAMTTEWIVVGASDEAVVYMRHQRTDHANPLASWWGRPSTLNAWAPIGRNGFGAAVSIGANRLVVGAPADEHAGFGSGAAYVFRRDDSAMGPGRKNVWRPEAKLVAPSPSHREQFGDLVDVWGDTVVVGTWNEEDLRWRNDPSPASSGALYLFRCCSGDTAWDAGQVGCTPLTKFVPAEIRMNHGYAWSVAIDENWIVAGAPGLRTSADNIGTAFALSAEVACACGDGVLDDWERCDDGNMIRGDGCSSICRLERGYRCEGEPSVCHDINECEEGSHNCNVNATCSNEVGGFTCTCNEGYEGDGVHCTDAEPRLFFIPYGADPHDYGAGPTIIRANPGERVCVEIRMQGESAFESADVTVPIADDAWSHGTGNGRVHADCTSAAIDRSHPDDAGFYYSLVQTMYCGPDAPYGLGLILYRLFGLIDIGHGFIPTMPGAAYLGEVCYDVPLRASGEFNIEFERWSFGGVSIYDGDWNPVLTPILDPLVIIVPHEPGDFCELALPAQLGWNFASNREAEGDDAEASCQDDSNNDLWFEYVAPCNASHHISTLGSHLQPLNDTVLAVFDGCGGRELACDDDGGDGLLSELVFEAIAGDVYLIRVAGVGDNVGDIVLRIDTLERCIQLRDAERIDLKLRKSRQRRPRAREGDALP